MSESNTNKAVDVLKVRRLMLYLTIGMGIALGIASPQLMAADAPKKVERTYPFYPPAPAVQSTQAAALKTEGCQSCHLETDAKTMHMNPGVVLGCTDCHGGDASVVLAEGVMAD